MSIESVMPSNHLILCCPLLHLPPIPPSIRVFSSESTFHMRWSKYWSFIFNISPSSEHPGLISFRMDWLDLLAVQGTLKRLLQHHSSKASIIWHIQVWPKSNLLGLYSESDKEIPGIRSDRQSAWRTMDGGLWHCTGGSDQDHPHEKEMQKGKVVVWGGLTNSWEKKRSEVKSLSRVRLFAIPWTIAY